MVKVDAARDALRLLVPEVAPTLVFYVALAIAGLRVAIAASVTFVVLDAGRRLTRHLGFTRLYMLSTLHALDRADCRVWRG